MQFETARSGQTARFDMQFETARFGQTARFDMLFLSQRHSSIHVAGWE